MTRATHFDRCRRVAASRAASSRATTSGTAQRGATLIITLVMLVLITLVCLSTIRATTVDEKMAGTARDRDRALQAAEAAMRVCIAQITNSTFTGVTMTPAPSTTPPNWEVAANWGNANSTAVTVDSALSAQPRCMVEALGSGTGSLRITGRAVGLSALTEVILQATYSTE